MQTKGSPVASRYIASTGQAFAHAPQRMQSFFFTTTPPPFLWEYAPVGQADTQGAGSQTRQSRASNPVERPPEDLIRIPAVSQESRLCTSRAQASEHEWHPMQRSILGVVRIFMVFTSFYLSCILEIITFCHAFAFD